MDNGIDWLSIGPSNHPGIDFIIENAKAIAEAIKKEDPEVEHVCYSVDSGIRYEEMARVLRNKEPLKSEYNIRFVI